MDNKALFHIQTKTFWSKNQCCVLFCNIYVACLKNKLLLLRAGNCNYGEPVSPWGKLVVLVRKKEREREREKGGWGSFRVSEGGSVKG